MEDGRKQTIANLLKDIERYNPENLPTLECYVEHQCRENTYDLEANLAVLKLYQLNPQRYNIGIICQILLKALTNLPHTDFVLCKCLLNAKHLEESLVKQIMQLADVLERCDFREFWARIHTPEFADNVVHITGFHDSIRKYVCHVVGITFQTVDKTLLAGLLGGVDDQTLKQWVKKYGWKEEANGIIFVANQDENIKTKNITEKIDFENAAAIMAASQ
ncbi:hypothetical protein R5R35_014574 [Gryllus longicercus]|uniref:Eukaryotic translation initiation factor 3 subunit K n=1 Tax=Gryllus longicercus TaxID=2509291 RepID=A0AAN9Z190_9ORTH